MKKLLPIIILISGCSDKNTPDRTAQLEARIAALEQASKPKLDLQPVPTNGFAPIATAADLTNLAIAVEAELSKMATAADLSNLEQQLWGFQVTNALREPKWIPIDMTSHGYLKLNTGLLTVLVSAVNASPYLDGFRVTLAIANPYSITFQGLTVHTITHGAELRFSGNEFTNLEEYNASAKHRDFDQTETLFPGLWNNVSFELVPATAQELRTLEISLELKRVGVATGP